MADRPRIMMVSTHGYVSANPEFGMPDTGGQVVYVLELSKSLARLGCCVDILTRGFDGQPGEETVAPNVRILRFPCGGDGFIPKETLCDDIPEWVDNALRFLESAGLKYAFINSHYWDGGLAGQGMSARVGILHLHAPHSVGAWKRDNMDGDPADLEREYNFERRIRDEKRVYGECDGVIATTPAQRRILVDKTYDTDPGKVFVIPPGYDDTRFYPVSDAQRAALKSRYDHEGPLVLSLGRMARNKGYDLLLRAMPVVFDRVDDAKLLLAPGSLTPSEDEVRQMQELRDLAGELGIADRVILRSYITDEELPDHYRMADVFALSSRYEPFGMTAIEAMGCGTPTVLTTQGGLWEQVTLGVEALCADPFDTEAFGQAICEILQTPRLAVDLARNGPRKARSDFTWTAIARRLLELVENLRPRRTET